MPSRSRRRKGLELRKMNMRLHYSFGVLSVIGLLLQEYVAAQPCTICTHGPDMVPFPDKQIAADDQAPANTCGFLESTQSFVQQGTDFCQGIRAVGTRCGCNIPPNACHLCWDETLATHPELELPDYVATTLIPASPAGQLMSCESLEGYLHTIDANDAQCSTIQLDAAERCGCPPLPGSEPQNRTETPQPPVQTQPPVEEEEQEQEQEPVALCTVCIKGEPIPWPEKPLELGDLPISSCADLQLFAGLLPGDSDDCAGLQMLGSYCGCEKEPDACTLCPNGEPVPKKQQKLGWFEDFAADVPDAYASVGDNINCEVMEAIVAGYVDRIFEETKDIVCRSTQLKSTTCGCSPNWIPIALTWSYRCFGLLSFLVRAPKTCSCCGLPTFSHIPFLSLFSFCKGSMLIISDILRKPKVKRFTTYHQLVLAMSCFDTISSLAYIFVGVLHPVEDGFWNARGNMTTCRMQGVMVQIGFTSLYYNTFLAIYFFLVICYNWKEHQFVKYLRYLHAIIVVVGVSMGFGVIPFVGGNGTQHGVCSLLKPPVISSRLPLTFFYTTPLSLAIAIITSATLSICVYVYRQQLKARRWMANSNMVLTQEVFWRSFWYVIAFYATQPIMLGSYYGRFENSNAMLALNFMVAWMAPSQGSLNALVYFRRSRGYKVFLRPITLLTSVFKKTSSQSNGDGNQKPPRDKEDTAATSMQETASSRRREDGREEEEDEEDNDQTPDENDKEHAEEASMVESGEASPSSTLAKRNNTKEEGPRETGFEAINEYWRLNEGSINDDEDGAGDAQDP